jgi:hypothetical protein
MDWSNKSTGKILGSSSFADNPDEVVGVIEEFNPPPATLNIQALGH